MTGVRIWSTTNARTIASCWPWDSGWRADFPPIDVRIDDLHVYSAEYARWAPVFEEAVPVEGTGSYRRVQETPRFPDLTDPMHRPDGRHDLGVLIRFTVTEPTAANA